LNGWLLDTNVISELRRPGPERKVVDFIAAKPLQALYISSVAIAEIRFGIETVENTIRRAELQEWLANKVRPMFAGRVLPLSEDVILKWRLLVAEGQRARYTFAQPDLFVAATALLHGLTVVTRDVGDYDRARVAVVNPWI
jgi:toxin FitB